MIIERKTALILIGPPCCGKSTWVKNNIEKLSNFGIISTDEYIENYANSMNKTYSEVFNDCIKQATKKMYQHLYFCMNNNMNIVWDQTNINIISRKKIWILKENGYYMKAVVFNLNREILIQRLNKRANSGKIIPIEIFNSFLDRYEIPSFDEGFDEIEYYTQKLDN